jgi:hypothetical protein
MAAIDKTLQFLKTSGSINYAATAKKFECDETTLRRRHQGKQRARRDADSLYRYTKLGESPLFAASIILYPSLGMSYLEVNWASEEQLV